MAEQYASIIIDISHEDVDRVFQYRSRRRFCRRSVSGCRSASLLVQETEHEPAMWWKSQTGRIMIKTK